MHPDRVVECSSLVGAFEGVADGEMEREGEDSIWNALGQPHTLENAPAPAADISP